MRISHLATALAAFTAGLTAAATLRRLAGRTRSVVAALPSTAISSVPTVGSVDAVVLPFARPTPAGAPQQVSSPARCGESGGRTKAGAPCGARTTTGGRCHHHPMAA